MKNPYKPLSQSTEAQRARHQLYAAIRKGLLPNLGLRQTRCVDCGDIALHHDHRDYSKPLEVEPVCGSCNAKRGPAVVSVPRPPNQKYVRPPHVRQKWVLPAAPPDRTGEPVTYFQAVVDHFGSRYQLAKALGITRMATYQWKSIPDHWVDKIRDLMQEDWIPEGELRPRLVRPLPVPRQKPQKRAGSI